jgi:hypothetical protein
MLVFSFVVLLALYAWRPDHGTGGRIQLPFLGSILRPAAPGRG